VLTQSKKLLSISRAALSLKPSVDCDELEYPSAISTSTFPVHCLLGEFCGARAEEPLFLFLKLKRRTGTRSFRFADVKKIMCAEGNASRTILLATHIRRSYSILYMLNSITVHNGPLLKTVRVSYFDVVVVVPGTR
jgi:hypothetical protein